MKSLGNDVYKLSAKTHVWSQIYQEFYHGIVYTSIANEVVILELALNYNNTLLHAVVKKINYTIKTYKM
jgi:hypothetical protein